MKQVTCAWCGKEYEIKNHYYDRKIREGKAFCCTKGCGNRLSTQRRKDEAGQAKEESLYQSWKRGYNEGYQQAILDDNKTISVMGG